MAKTKRIKPVKAWAVITDKGAIAHWAGGTTLAILERRSDYVRYGWNGIGYRLARVEIKEIKP